MIAETAPPTITATTVVQPMIATACQMRMRALPIPDAASIVAVLEMFQNVCEQNEAELGRLDAVAGDVAEESGGHLGASGVVHADEENGGLGGRIGHGNS